MQDFDLGSMQPTLHISSQKMPALDYYSDGEEIELDVKVKVKSITKRDGHKTTAELVIMSIDEKPPQEVTAMRHAEYRQALAREAREVAEARGEIA